jgi:heme/copper-type cytochrome/quinol oxidase subunit 4
MAITSHDPIPTSQLDGAVKDYSRDKVYVLTALFLAFLTVVEVLTYAFPDFPAWSGNLVIVVLMILMAIKFFVVVHIFMHLRFDKPILSWIFWAGLILAGSVYFAALCTFRIFWPGSHG